MTVFRWLWASLFALTAATSAAMGQTAPQNMPECRSADDPAMLYWNSVQAYLNSLQHGVDSSSSQTSSCPWTPGNPFDEGTAPCPTGGRCPTGAGDLPPPCCACEPGTGSWWPRIIGDTAGNVTRSWQRTSCLISQAAQAVMQTIGAGEEETAPVCIMDASACRRTATAEQAEQLRRQGAGDRVIIYLMRRSNGTCPCQPIVERIANPFCASPQPAAECCVRTECSPETAAHFVKAIRFGGGNVFFAVGSSNAKKACSFCTGNLACPFRVLFNFGSPAGCCDPTKDGCCKGGKAGCCGCCKCAKGASTTAEEKQGCCSKSCEQACLGGLAAAMQESLARFLARQNQNAPAGGCCPPNTAWIAPPQPPMIGNPFPMMGHMPPHGPMAPWMAGETPAEMLPPPVVAMQLHGVVPGFPISGFGYAPPPPWMGANTPPHGAWIGQCPPFPPLCGQPPVWGTTVQMNNPSAGPFYHGPAFPYAVPTNVEYQQTQAVACPRAEDECKIVAKGDGVYITTSCIEAKCQRMTCTSNRDCVVLEGDVRLVCKRGGQVTRIQAPRVTVDLSQGTFTVEAVSAPAPVSNFNVGFSR